MNIHWISLLWLVVLFATYMMMSCFGLYLIKVAESWKTSTFLIGFGFYGAGAAIWIVILRLMPLSLAFPIAAGALVLGTMLTGMLFLSEHITAWQITGAAMIVIGITLITFKS